MGAAVETLQGPHRELQDALTALQAMLAECRTGEPLTQVQVERLVLAMLRVIAGRTAAMNALTAELADVEAAIRAKSHP